MNFFNLLSDLISQDIRTVDAASAWLIVSLVTVNYSNHLFIIGL